MQVDIVAYTVAWPLGMDAATEGKWHPDGTTAADVSVFAGRACYQSWSKPNPATATTDGYIEHIFDIRHWSVLEHGTVTFCISDVSRSFTHELIRHRHLSYSQLSQRYAPLADTRPVVPPLLRGDEQAGVLLNHAWESAKFYYGHLLNRAKVLAEEQGFTGTMARKRAQEAARAVLPNMTGTQIVVTGNHRAWIEFLLQRGAVTADLEIREVAFEILHKLRGLEPSIYRNLVIEGSGVLAEIKEREHGTA